MPALVAMASRSLAFHSTQAPYCRAASRPPTIKWLPPRPSSPAPVLQLGLTWAVASHITYRWSPLICQHEIGRGRYVDLNVEMSGSAAELQSPRLPFHAMERPGSSIPSKCWEPNTPLGTQSFVGQGWLHYS